MRCASLALVLTFLTLALSACQSESEADIQLRLQGSVQDSPTAETPNLIRQTTPPLTFDERACQYSIQVALEQQDVAALQVAVTEAFQHRMYMEFSWNLHNSFGEEKVWFPLAYATALGRLDLMLILIKGGANIDYAANWTSGGSLLKTPLMVAVRTRQHDAIRLLLANKADVHAYIPGGENPAFWWAAKISDIESMKLLLAAGATADDMSPSSDYDGASFELCAKAGLRWCRASPLAEAISEGRTDIVDFLLEQGASPSGPKNTVTPLYLAAAAGDFALVQRLINLGAEVVSYANPLAAVISTGGSVKMIRLLLSAKDAKYWLDYSYVFGRSPEGSHKDLMLTPLSHAAREKRTDLIEALLQAGADPNKQDYGSYSGDDPEMGMTPLRYAAENGCVECANLVIKAGARPDPLDRYGVTPLQKAADLGHSDIVTVLIKAGADVNHVDRPQNPYLDPTCRPLCHAPALNRAAYQGSSSIVHELLVAGAKPDTFDFYAHAKEEPLSRARGAPLLWASHFGNEKVVATLLDKRADVKVVDLHGNNALMWATNATGNAFSVIARKLVSWGLDVNASNHEGFTALHRVFGPAPTGGVLEKVKTLIRLRADVNASSKRGSTPLMYASGLFGPSYPDAITALVRAGAGLNAKNSMGDTAVDISLRSGSSATKDLLCSLGAQHSACALQN